MRQAEQRFQFVADMLPQIIWSARPDGWFDYYNRRWFELTGMTLEAAQGVSRESAVHPERGRPLRRVTRRTPSKPAKAVRTDLSLRRASDGIY